MIINFKPKSQLLGCLKGGGGQEEKENIIDNSKPTCSIKFYHSLKSLPTYFPILPAIITCLMQDNVLGNSCLALTRCF